MKAYYFIIYKSLQNEKNVLINNDDRSNFKD